MMSSTSNTCRPFTSMERGAMATSPSLIVVVPRYDDALMDSMSMPWGGGLMARTRSAENTNAPVITGNKTGFKSA